MSPLIRICLIALLTPLSLPAEDRIVHYDSAGSRVTLERNKQLRTYGLTPASQLTINGAPAPLEKLSSGMVANVTLSGAQTVSQVAAGLSGRIEKVAPTAITIAHEGGATSFRIPPGTPVIIDDRPSVVGKLVPGMTVSAFSNTPEVVSRLVVTGTRDVLVEAYIDGKDDLKIKDGELWVEHRDYLFPKGFVINNRSWIPAWTPPTSSRFRPFQKGETSFKGAHVLVTKVSGRSTMVVDQPSPENDYTLTITITDKPNGFDEFAVRITW